MAFLSYLVPTASAVGLMLLIIRIFRSKIKFIFKLLCNIVFGLGALLIFNYFGSIWNFTIELNLANGLIAGICGVPGFVALLIIKILGLFMAI